MAIVMGVLPLGAQVCSAAAASYIPPVDGEIISRFDPPLGPYASGHRGIDFGVSAGSQVVASHSGDVTFAGPVADTGFFVTLSHPGQITTTYSFLSEVLVTAGDHVRRGQSIAFSGHGHGTIDALHFGAKLAGAYIDPEILLSRDFDDISDVIALAPLDEPGGAAGSLTSGGSGALRPVSAFRLASSGPSKGWAVAVGEKIAGVGKTMFGFFSGLAKSAGGLFSSSWNSLVDAGVTTWETTKMGLREGGHLLSVGGKRSWGMLRSAAKMIKSRAIALGRRGFDAMRKSWDGLKSIWRSFVEKGRVLVAHGRRIGKIPDSFTKGLSGFIVGIVKGALKQVKCSVQGGAKAPAIGSKSLPPPNNNIVVAIAGIGSSTKVRDGKIVPAATIYEMDWGSLGYKPEQIYNFSYKGVENRGGDGPYRLHAPYSKEDTYKDIADAAVVLAEQVHEVRAKNPEKRVDLVAHSQGGLVAQYFISFLSDPDDTDSLQLDHFVTIASPHRGADAAQIGTLLADNPKSLSDLDALAARTGLPPASAESATQLSEGSTFLADLNAHWDADKVKTTTIGASFDYVVTAPHTRLPGATHYTADLSWGEALNSHSGIVNSTSTKSYLYSALADRKMACTALRDAFAEQGTGALISGIEDEIAHGINLIAEFAR